MRIGVFDSGIGGKAIADHLQRDYPKEIIHYVDDHEHVPYGNRSTDEIIRLTDQAIQPLLESRCDCIVIACNTATAAAIEFLRTKYPEVPFIGLEPMVKPAASATKTGVLAIFATPATLHSGRYHRLKSEYAADIKVLEPDCREWASMIEHNQIDDEHITRVVSEVIDRNADVIVLACTHYHWIKQKIANLATGKAVVMDPSEAISRQVGLLLRGDAYAKISANKQRK